MKKIKLNLKNFYLFSIPVDFDISFLKILSSNHLIVVINYQGYSGIGEGVLYHSTLIKTLSLLYRDLELFFNREFKNIMEVKTLLTNMLKDHPDILCAFDLALWDLIAKINHQPLYRQLGSNHESENPVPITEQIFIPKNGIDLSCQVKKLLTHQTKWLKLKAGRSLDQDLSNIDMIQKLSQGQLQIQVDLNQSLDFDQAVKFGQKLKHLGITIWEEPIKFKNFQELHKLRQRTGLKIILDESIRNINQLHEAIRAKGINILNIKLSRLGGITKAISFMKECRKFNIEIEVGCSEELGIGTVAQLHLGYWYRDIKALEGLGSFRLGFDIIKEKMVLKKGLLKIKTKKVGLGVNFSPQKLYGAGKKLKFAILTKNNNPSLSDYQSFFQTRLTNKFYNGWLWLNRLLNKK